MGRLGRSLSRRRGRDQPAQGRPAPQVPHGRPHPGTAPRPAGPGPLPSTNGTRTPTRCCTPPARRSPGDIFTAAGQTLTRVSDHHSTSGKIWADDLATGRRRDLAVEEDLAFWAWAAVEVLRLTGVRVEELPRSHHSLVQYRLPGTGELVPLLQIVPSKTDTERLLVVSPELADVLSAIIRRVRGDTEAVPLVRAYDRPECLWIRPAPLLFQRRFGADSRRICDSTIRNMLNAALASTGLTDPSGEPTALQPSRLPADLHHRRHHERPAPAHRPGHRRPPRL